MSHALDHRWLRSFAKSRILLACIAFVAASCVLFAQHALPASTTHTITMEGMAFIPSTLKVKKGDRIVWVNKDPFPHMATAADRAFDSGSIAADGSWLYTARVGGSYPYVCAFHPTMKALLVVE